MSRNALVLFIYIYIYIYISFIWEGGPLKTFNQSEVGLKLLKVYKVVKVQ